MRRLPFAHWRPAAILALAGLAGLMALSISQGYGFPAGSALQRIVGGLLAGLAVLRGVVHGEPSAGDHAIDRLVRFSPLLLGGGWLLGIAIAGDARPEFFADAFDASLLFIIAAALGLGTARLLSFALETREVPDVDRAWLVLVMVVVGSAVLVGLPVAALVGVPLARGLTAGHIGGVLIVLGFILGLIGSLAALVGAILGAFIGTGAVQPSPAPVGSPPLGQPSPAPLPAAGSHLVSRHPLAGHAPCRETGRRCASATLDRARCQGRSALPADPVTIADVARAARCARRLPSAARGVVGLRPPGSAECGDASGARQAAAIGRVRGPRIGTARGGLRAHLLWPG